MTGKAGGLTGRDPRGHSDWDGRPVLKGGSNFFFVIKHRHFIPVPGNEKRGWVGGEHAVPTPLTSITKSYSKHRYAFIYTRTYIFRL